MTSRAQSHPSLDDARELLEWEPPLGVLSVYVRIDPADRRGGWRTALRNGLADAVIRAQPAEHEARVALRSTADRIARRFGDQDCSACRAARSASSKSAASRAANAGGRPT